MDIAPTPASGIHCDTLSERETKYWRGVWEVKKQPRWGGSGHSAPSRYFLHFNLPNVKDLVTVRQ